MSAILSAPGRVVDVLLFPIERLPPLVGLAVIACLTAMGALLVMRLTSNQVRLVAVRQGIQAAMYEIWLFRGDVRAMGRSVGEVARLNVKYVTLSLVPALWMIVPSVVLIAHVQNHYGYRSLDVGRPALLKVHVTPEQADVMARDREDGDPVPQPLRLSASVGLRVETPPVWIPSLREFVWRIVPDWPGDHDVTVVIGDRSVRRRVAAAAVTAQGVPLRGAVTVRASDGLPIESLSVNYPRAGVAIFGHSFHWSIPFVAIMAACAWMLRRSFRVTL